MRYLAFAVATVLSLALVAPAFAQPFADVPTDHWAFDAIAELAAKGLIEGYPDGTFKGDRAMTRYEMAMVVARLLARIEAIKIPAPPKIPPPVDAEARRKLATVQRLVNEFRAELAALGVRVTAVEEELQALRARLDNTKTTGFAMVRYQFPVAGPGGTGSWTLVNLTHRGQLSPSASATFRLVAGNVVASLLTPVPCCTSANAVVHFDRAHIDLDWMGLKWRFGRQTYQLGPIGLLLKEGWIADPNLGFDGATVRATFGPVNFEAAGFRHTSAIDIFAVRGSVSALLPGWTLGVNYYTERHNFTSITPNIANNGWSVDLSGSIIPGLSLTVEYATFTPSAAATQTALQVNTTWNLGQLFGMTAWSPVLTIGYKNWDGPGAAVWSPLFPGTGDLIVAGFNFRDLNAWFVRLSLTASPQFRPYVAYESGFVNTTGASHTEFEIGVVSTLAQNTTGRLRYQRVESPAGTLLVNRYRAEVWFEW